MRHPCSLSKLDHSAIAKRNDSSISTEITQSYGNLHSVASHGSHISIVSPYKDTTFGTSKRMYLPPSKKFDFIDPETSLDRKYGVLTKSPRNIILTDYGHDSPSLIKYDTL